MAIFKRMIVLFLIMVIGFIARKREIIDAHMEKKLASLVIYITSPCMVLAGVLGESELTRAETLRMMGLTWIIFVVIVASSFLVQPILRVSGKPEGQIYQMLYAFPNVGFMGFPVMAAAFGNESLRYGALFILPFNTLIFTFGIYLMRRGQAIRLRQEALAAGREPEIPPKGSLWSQLRRILNIGVVVCIIAELCFFLNLTIPAVVLEACTMVGDMTGPICMIAIGAALSGLDFKKVITDPRMWGVCFLKLLVMPVAGYYLLRLCGVSDPLVLGVCLVVLGMPSGNLCAMLAQEFGGDVKLSSAGVAFTSLLAVATIPVVFRLCGM